MTARNRVNSVLYPSLVYFYFASTSDKMEVTCRPPNIGRVSIELNSAAISHQWSAFKRCCVLARPWFLQLVGPRCKSWAFLGIRLLFHLISSHPFDPLDDIAATSVHYYAIRYRQPPHPPPIPTHPDRISQRQTRTKEPTRKRTHSHFFPPTPGPLSYAHCSVRTLRRRRRDW